MVQKHYLYGNINIWGEGTYEKNGVAEILQCIDDDVALKAPICLFPVSIKCIDIYCLSDSPLLGWKKNIDEVKNRHDGDCKVIILLPKNVPESSIDHMENVTIIPYVNTVQGMKALLQAAFIRKDDRVKKTQKNHPEKRILHKYVQPGKIRNIASSLNVAPKTAYVHRGYYIKNILGFRNTLEAWLFFTGSCSD
ncbi:hypothetical protein JD793_004955 [Citrobacter braakii]|nr:hypothetical protein [Citrobacter braakii]